MSELLDIEARRARVLVVDRATALVEELRAGFDEDSLELHHLSRTGTVVNVVQGKGPWDMVVAGPSEHSSTGLARLVEVRAADPTVGLLVVVNGSDPTDLEELIHARPDELVRVPADTARLCNAVDATLEAAFQRRAGIRQQPARVVVATHHAQVIAVGGPTGGSGKTTVAVNLATLLAASGDRVVLVDADAQFGEVAPALALTPTYTLADIVVDEHDRPVDAHTIADALPAALAETPYGFSVLAAPRDPARADLIGPRQLETVLDELGAHADHVVVDTAPGLGELALHVLDQADHLVAVTQVDVPGIANLRTYLAACHELGIGDERLSVVLNKELARSGVTGQDVIDVLGPVAGVVPFSEVVSAALNEGVPMCTRYPHDVAAVALRQSISPLLPAAARFPAAVAERREPRRSDAGSWWQRRRAGTAGPTTGGPGHGATQTSTDEAPGMRAAQPAPLTRIANLIAEHPVANPIANQAVVEAGSPNVEGPR